VADNFGLKIGIEGEKEFKNAIREINQSFKVLGSEMNLVASQFDKQDKSVEAVTARNKVLNKEIELQKEKIATLFCADAEAGENLQALQRRCSAGTLQNSASTESAYGALYHSPVNVFHTIC
jgi:phage-related minor tail protein